MARKKKIITDLRLTGIADKGKAVGRTNDGEVVFTEGAVPGDIVDVQVLRKKKSMSEARVISIKSPSEERVNAPCKHFGICGGCKWQNLDYSAQIKYKYQNVVDSIQRIGKFNPDIVKPIIGCENNYRYRNKLEYSFSTKKWFTADEVASEDTFKSPGALGFHKPGFYDKIVDIDECLLQDDLTNKIRNFIRDFVLENNYSFYDVHDHKGLMRNVIVRNTLNGDWMVIVVFGNDNSVKIKNLMEAVKTQFPEITSLSYIVNQKWNDTIYDREVVNYSGDDYIIENLGHIKYRIGPKSFFQTNTIQAKILYDIAVKLGELTPEDNVYDLYTGLGSIALYISDSVKHVTGIEQIPEAIEDAEINKDINKIENATFYAGDVRDILNEDFSIKHGKPDVVITDPPRAGMHPDVISTLLDLAAPRMVYISCNPATQARDLNLLSEKYDVIEVQPVDMFPHTSHIESVAQLKLKSTI